MAIADRRMVISIKTPLSQEDWEAIHELNEHSTDVDEHNIRVIMDVIKHNRKRYALSLVFFPIKIVYNILAGNYYPCLAEHQYMLKYITSPMKKLTEKAYEDMYLRPPSSWFDGA